MPIAPKAIADFHNRLHRWYKKHGRRHLPWRNTRDPYHIYLSEIMLQQTQVTTVLDRYYFPFLERFPTLSALAKAPLQEVLKAWEGLGYYTRAGNLHKAAIASAKRFPKDVEGLIALPGIGRNTAHAIAAFAYHHPVPVMEANVKRVLCRVFALKQADEKILWQKAEALLDRKHPFDYNQAMMDIGSMVCTKRAPQCPKCPAHEICKGQLNPENYPAPKAKKKVPVRQKIILVEQNGNGDYYLSARTTRFLNGLYGFPEIDIRPARAKKLGSITQSYSHFTLEADVYFVTPSFHNGEHYSIAEIKKLPLSKADEKVVKLILLQHK